MAGTVEERVKNVVSSLLKVPVDEVKLEANFTRDLGAESIQSIELVAAFEAEFDIDMDQDEALAISTVGDAVNFIQKVVDEQHG